jgi:hypothetical protein
MYLSDIQRGIQTAHVVSEMAFQERNEIDVTVFTEWAADHKTIIVLNGGNCASLKGIRDHITEFFSNGYLSKCFRFSESCIPMASFYEDEQSLNGALTAVGIILPNWLYDEEKAMKIMRVSKRGTHDAMCILEFIAWLKSFPLA